MKVIVISTGMKPTFRRINKVMIKRLLVTSLCFVTIVSCHNISGAPPMPDGVRFVPRPAWGAHAPVLPMAEHVPRRLTIHHTATAQNPARPVEQKMSGLQAFSQRDDSLASG